MWFGKNKFAAGVTASDDQPRQMTGYGMVSSIRLVVSCYSTIHRKIRRRLEDTVPIFFLLFYVQFGMVSLKRYFLFASREKKRPLRTSGAMVSFVYGKERG